MNKKQLLTVIAILSALCLCVVGLGVFGLYRMGNSMAESFKNADNPESVRKIASSIVDYTLPAGYKELAVDLVFYKYLMLTPDTEKSGASGPMIMLMSYPNSTQASEAQVQENMARAFQQQGAQTAVMRVVDTFSATIRGKDAKVTVLEGKTNTNLTLRQWMTVFKGPNGLVVMMIQGSASDWDDAMLKQFIGSIK